MVILMVPIFFGSNQDSTQALAETLRQTFRAEIVIRPCWFDPESTLDPNRGQYHSTALLKQLLTTTDKNADRVLGVTSVDLFIPILTYVFGEAQLDGNAAIVSSHRLQNKLYGLAADKENEELRLQKEAIHEIGHTFGLTHCTDMTCVMKSSTYVEELDLKSESFCTECVRKLKI